MAELVPGLGGAQRAEAAVGVPVAPQLVPLSDQCADGVRVALGGLASDEEGGGDTLVREQGE